MTSTSSSQGTMSWCRSDPIRVPPTRNHLSCNPFFTITSLNVCRRVSYVRRTARLSDTLKRLVFATWSGLVYVGRLSRGQGKRRMSWSRSKSGPDSGCTENAISAGLCFFPRNFEHGVQEILQFFSWYVKSAPTRRKPPARIVWKCKQVVNYWSVI